MTASKVAEPVREGSIEDRMLRVRSGLEEAEFELGRLEDSLSVVSVPLPTPINGVDKPMPNPEPHGSGLGVQLAHAITRLGGIIARINNLRNSLDLQ